MKMPPLWKTVGPGNGLLFGSTPRIECTSVKREIVLEYVSVIALTYCRSHNDPLAFILRDKKHKFSGSLLTKGNHGINLNCSLCSFCYTTDIKYCISPHLKQRMCMYIVNGNVSSVL